MAGLPIIDRCPASVAQDGFRGGINYDGNDRFCLDNKRLMAVSGVYGANLTEYRSEIDSGVKVVSYGTAGSGPAYFKVFTKEGNVMEFGNSADSKIEAQGKASARVWALNKLQDGKGNYLTVSYFEDNANGEYRPIRIDYTGNTGLSTTRSVRFFYESRSDVIPMYEGGSLFRTSMRMTNIQTYVGTTLVRDYRLGYQNGTATGRSRLISATECAADGSCLPANNFTWQEGGIGFLTPQTWGTYGCGTWCGAEVVGDFNADGKMDFMYRSDSNIKVYLSNGTGFDPPQVWGTYSCGTTCFADSTGDFNGDGKTDFMYIDTGRRGQIFCCELLTFVRTLPHMSCPR